ncbi:MAG: putative metallopeptidase [Nitrososphaerales archaeon]
MRFSSGLEYSYADDVKKMAESIVNALSLGYIDLSRLGFVRSRGSRSRQAVARIHAVGRAWEAAFNIRPMYLIEVISERFDRLSQQEKEKVIIHELLHIPKGFSGGFVPHGRGVNRRRVDEMYAKYIEKSILFRC